MNKNYQLFFCLLTLLLWVALPCSAEVLRYTDDSGKRHYVTSLEQVPQQYRDQLKDAPPLPNIGRTSTPDWQYRAPSASRSRSASKPVMLVMQSCGYCRQLEQFLKSNRISYTRLDIQRDSRGKKMYDEVGGGGVPITIVGSQVVRGYNPQAVMSAISSR